MRTSIILLVTSLALAGCATPEQRAAAMQADMDRIVQIYGPACGRLGFAPNTDGWRTCLLQLSTREEMQRSYYDGPYYHGYGRRYWGPYW